MSVPGPVAGVAEHVASLNMMALRERERALTQECKAIAAQLYLPALIASALTLLETSGPAALRTAVERFGKDLS